MEQQEKTPNTKRIKVILIICLFLVIAAITSEILWSVHIRRLRSDMEDHLNNSITSINLGAYTGALTDAEAAMILAVRLRDEEAINKVDAYAVFMETMIRADELFDAGSYDSALESYRLVYDYLTEINTRYPDQIQLTTNLLNEKITITEMYIAFFSFIKQAEIHAEASDYNAAISSYESARAIAAALFFTEGIGTAEAGIAEMQERIIIAKRREASEYYNHGHQLSTEELYDEALVYYYKALELYKEIEDYHSIMLTQAKIDFTEDLIIKMNTPDPPADGGTQDDPDDPDDTDEFSANYAHNINLDFDMETPIDDQNRRPANQVRMGTSEGMNEGWYNGCGWVAAYNALLVMGSPRHPAEIVLFFEESGGTVFDGVFGTYPNAIEDYLKSFGFNVGHTLFPGLRVNIDDTIKASKVSILAYAHTSAAHYTAIEYREDIQKFVIYNDGSARTRSTELGFQNETKHGAAIDSVAAFLSSTPTILFSFSLITVN